MTQYFLPIYVLDRVQYLLYPHCLQSKEKSVNCAHEYYNKIYNCDDNSIFRLKSNDEVSSFCENFLLKTFLGFCLSMTNGLGNELTKWKLSSQEFVKKSFARHHCLLIF